MKKAKMFLALVLCVAAFISTLSVGYAYDMNDILEEVPDYFTEEYQADLQKIMDEVDAYINKKMMARTGAQKKLTVPLIQQSEDYYCGPASALMVIKFKNNNTTLTQSILAGKDYCNTTISNGTSVDTLTYALNKVMGSGMYKAVSTSQQSFGSALIYSVDKNYPVVCNVLTGALPAYNGANYRHYVVATGYRYGFTAQTNENVVIYNDPHYEPKYYGTYDIDWRYMIEAINDNKSLYIMKS